MFSSFAFESAHHNLIKKCSKSVSPLQLTETVSKRFLRDFFRARIAKIVTNDLTFSTLTLKNHKSVQTLQPGHPLFQSEKCMIKTAKNFVFENSNYHCHDDACPLRQTGCCNHFVKYSDGHQVKFGLLTSMHFDLSETKAVLSVLEFSFKPLDFTLQVTNDDVRKVLNSLKEVCPLGYLVHLTGELDHNYVKLSQLLNPCVVYKQNNDVYCFNICQVIEHN